MKWFQKEKKKRCLTCNFAISIKQPSYASIFTFLCATLTEPPYFRLGVLRVYFILQVKKTEGVSEFGLSVTKIIASRCGNNFSPSQWL